MWLHPGLCGMGAGMATSRTLSRWFLDHFGQGERAPILDDWAEELSQA